jgi:hypothetical protein
MCNLGNGITVAIETLQDAFDLVDVRTRSVPVVDG